jgi:hypothetical protein
MWRLLAGLVLVVGFSLAAAPSASAQYCSMGTSNTVPGFRSGWYGGTPSFYSTYYSGYPYGQYPSGSGVYAGQGGVAGGGSQPYFGAGYVDPTFYDTTYLGNYVNPYYNDIVGNMPFWPGLYGGQYPYYSTFYGGYPAYGGFAYNPYCGYSPYGYGGGCSPIFVGSNTYNCR